MKTLIINNSMFFRIYMYMVIVVFFLTSCSNETTNNNTGTTVLTGATESLSKYTVTFDSNKATERFSKQIVEEGKLVTKPTDPNRSNFSFIGWITRERKNFNFNDPITNDITLYAHWRGGPITSFVFESAKNASIGADITGRVIVGEPASRDLDKYTIEASIPIRQITGYSKLEATVVSNKMIRTPITDRGKLDFSRSAVGAPVVYTAGEAPDIVTSYDIIVKLKPSSNIFSNFVDSLTNNSSTDDNNLPTDNLNFIDTSDIKVMTLLFHNKANFNSEISDWDMSNVTNMDSMFYGASAFNQPIGNWNVSKVTNMIRLFYGATKFNQDISSWDVSKVTIMSGMFRDASDFNQDIGDWNVKNVTTMARMFYKASKFNYYIGDWDVKNVTTMNSMFHEVSEFNQYIGNWDVSNVIDVSGMFFKTVKFNQSLKNWDVSKVTSMSGMFRNAVAFNQNLDVWNNRLQGGNIGSLIFEGSPLATNPPCWYTGSSRTCQ